MSIERTFFDIDLPDSSRLFFASDTHFGHRRLVTSCPTHFERCRRYETVEEMNADIMDKWNSRVAPDDYVVFLGDFLFGNWDKGEQSAADLWDKLNGIKFFVRGNHDQGIKGEIIDIRDYALIRHGGLTYLCQHFPFGNGPNSDMTVLGGLKSSIKPADTVLVHGHTHFSDRVSRTLRKDFSLQNDVSWEAWYGMVPAERLYAANRTYVGKCLGHPVVANYSKECTDEQ